MSKTVYVISWNGEPTHVYSDFEGVEKECETYLKTRPNADQLFRWWAEDNPILEHVTSEEVAWDIYVHEYLASFEWDNYAWYEVPLD